MSPSRRYLLNLFTLVPLIVLLEVIGDLFLLQQSAVSNLIESLEDRQFDVLFLGDSTIRATGDCDSGSQGIDQWLGELGDFSVLTVEHGGYSPIVYKELVEIITSRGHKPKLIIFPINPRSFSDAWFTKPQYSFELDRLRARARYASFSRSDLFTFLRLRYSNELTDREESWTSNRVVYGDLDLGVRSELFKEMHIPGREAIECKEGRDEDFSHELKLRFSYHYMNIIEESHGMFDHLTGTVEIAKAAGIEVLVYLMPTNYADATRFVGPIYTARSEANLNVIRRELQRLEVPFLDLSHALPRERFVDRFVTCEHLDDLGRRHVAEALAESVQANLNPL